MESAILKAIVGALGVGVLEGTKEVAKRSLADAYEKLRSTLLSRLGSLGNVEAALTSLEKKPDSKARQEVLTEELKASGASSDQVALGHASTLLQLVEKFRPLDCGSQVAYGTGIAQADRHSSASVTIRNDHE